MKTPTQFGVVLLSLLLMPLCAMAAGEVADLRGDWAFQLDEHKVGEQERWFGKELADKIRLPGSTDEAGFGKKSEPDPVSLTREHRYVGPAWYQKTITIPESWQGKQVTLFLERAMWEPKVWLDDHYIGMEKEHMTDGDLKTFWHSQFQPDFAKPPHHVVLEVPEGTPVSGLTYVAYAGGNGNGHVKRCSVYASDDGKSWGKPLVKSRLKSNVYSEQQIMFPAPSQKKFIKFVATDAVSAGGQPIAAIGELDVLITQEKSNEKK